MIVKTPWPRKLISFIISITLLLFIILTLFTPLSMAEAPDHEDRIPALLNLSTGFEHEFYADLDGEWFFFEEKLLSPTDVYHYIIRDQTSTVHIPSSF